MTVPPRKLFYNVTLRVSTEDSQSKDPQELLESLDSTLHNTNGDLSKIGELFVILESWLVDQKSGRKIA